MSILNKTFPYKSKDAIWYRDNIMKLVENNCNNKKIIFDTDIKIKPWRKHFNIIQQCTDKENNGSFAGRYGEILVSNILNGKKPINVLYGDFALKYKNNTLFFENKVLRLQYSVTKTDKLTSMMFSLSAVPNTNANFFILTLFDLLNSNNILSSIIPTEYLEYWMDKTLMAIGFISEPKYGTSSHLIEHFYSPILTNAIKTGKSLSQKQINQMIKHILKQDELLDNTLGFLS